MSELYRRVGARLEGLCREGRRRQLVDTGERRGPSVLFGDGELLNCSSNDYLGLGDDPCLLERFMASHGEAWPPMSASSSRLLTGTHRMHVELEAMLASLYGREAALVFNSGYHANIGILPALAGRHDIIFSDRLNHASIIDGLKLSEAPWKRYRHGDYQHLEELLHAASGQCRQPFIVTESVFSMDGDLADLRRLVELKRRYGAVLLVDEAHAVGTMGERGLGLCEASGLLGEVDIIIGTFGKAFASTGAYAIMDSLLRDYLVNTMRPFIFTTALPPMVVAWSRHVLQRQLRMAEERRHLAALGHFLRERLRRQGFEVPGASHIVPVIAGSDAAASAMAGRLRDAGFLALPVRPPTVAENSSRVRLSLRSVFTTEQMRALADAFGEGGR